MRIIARTNCVKMISQYIFVLCTLSIVTGCISASLYSSFDRPATDSPDSGVAFGNKKIACVEYEEPRTRIFDILIDAAMKLQRREFKVLKLCSPDRDAISGLIPPQHEGGFARHSSRLRIIFDIRPSGEVTNARYFKSDHETFFRNEDNQLTRHSLEAVKNFIFTPQFDDTGAPRTTENVIMTFKYYP